MGRDGWVTVSIVNLYFRHFIYELCKIICIIKTIEKKFKKN